jgi:PIN domain nuclease of toxin-antitoxin system
MKRVLLDTQLLLWALGSPTRIPASARKVIETAEVYVSASSIWEIAIKSGLGKLAADPAEIVAALQPAGFLALPVTAEHAAHVARLPAIHRDPFDRLLVAQALTEPMHLLTTDAVLAGYGPVVSVV